MSRSKRPSVPSYRLHKPTGLAVVRLNERDYYLGPHDTEASRAAYERIIAEWIANGRRLPPNYSPVVPEATGQTVNELFTAYWRYANEYYRKNGQPTGEQHNIKDAVRLLIALYGDVPLSEFGPCSLKAVRQRMLDHDLSRRVINARVNRIRRMFKWGVENEMVDAKVLQALQAIAPLKRGRCQAREMPEVKPVPQAHIDAVLERVSQQVGAMVRLQLLTGMRPGEVTIMRGCDLDTSGRIWVYRPASHKTEHHDVERLIVLDQDLPRAGCWSHARRKFVEAEPTAPDLAGTILRLIKNLFEVEALAKSLSDEERLGLRQVRSRPIVDALHGLFLEQTPRLLPKHPMAEAIGYALNQWKELTYFLADGAAPIHNNLAEQQMKRIALLRKNALFVATPHGGETAAILSTITSTCRRHGINPQVYLTQLLTNFQDAPSSRIDEWLPDRWKAAQDGYPSPSPAPEPS